jgi:hypothetical protein
VISSLFSSMNSRNEVTSWSGPFGGVFGVPGVEDLVDGDHVDGLLVGAAHVDQLLAELGVGGDGGDGASSSIWAGLRGDGGVGCRVVSAGGDLGGDILLVGIEGVDQPADELRSSIPARSSSSVPVGRVICRLRRASRPGDRGDDIGVAVPRRPG